jgi:cell division protein ZipA
MELGGREILLALGALLIVAILLDGFRRVHRAGKGKLRVKRRKQPIFEDDNFDEFGSELPGGGARVVAFRDEDSAEQLSQAIKANREFDKSRMTAPFRQTELVAAKPEENRQSSESSDYEDEESDGEEVIGSRLSDEWGFEEAKEDSQISLFGETSVPHDREDGLDASAFASEDCEPVENPAPKTLKKSHKSKVAKKQTSLNHPGKAAANKNKVEGRKPESKAASDIVEDDVIILHLMAEPGAVFQGEELLKAVVNHGLRYGSLKIFHRHVREDGSGDVLFSMANSINPGTFELNSMDEFSTPGVTFMMVMEDSDDPLGTFDMMLECIHGVNSAIGGELKDQQRSALSQQTAEHYRQRIMDFNRRRLTANA